MRGISPFELPDGNRDAAEKLFPRDSNPQSLSLVSEKAVKEFEGGDGDRFKLVTIHSPVIIPSNASNQLFDEVDASRWWPSVSGEDGKY
jgi:hypothetical protein